MKLFKNKSNLKVAVIGLGYTGLPLLIELSKKFYVIGLDISKKRINELNQYIDQNNEYDKAQLKENKNNIKFTYDYRDLSEINFYIVCVPTPIKSDNCPDLRNLISASNMISKVISKDDTVVFESTVYPGVTEKICGKLISKKAGLEIIYNDSVDKGFYLGYSPERINPGDAIHSIKKITKIISGSSKNSLKIIKKVYSSIVGNNLHIAKTIKIAEAAKLLENSQRDLNIAFINEYSKILKKNEIEIKSVLNAAKTKWNFLNFKPGLVGGHCIPVDTYYLIHYARNSKYLSNFIESGRILNKKMTSYVFNLILSYFKKRNINTKTKLCLFIGMTFKENVSDIRNSQNIVLFEKLSKIFKSIDFLDKHLDQNFKYKNKKIKRVYNLDKSKRYSLIVYAVDHSNNRISNNQLIYFKKKFNTIICDTTLTLDSAVSDIAF